MKNLDIENIKKRKCIVSTNDYDVKLLDDNKLEFTMPISKNTLNPLGIVHGGIIYTLMDNCAGTLAIIKGKKSVTLNSSVNFIKSCKSGYLRAVASIVHAGGTTLIMDIEVFDDKDKLLANGSFTMYILNDIKEEDLV